MAVIVLDRAWLSSSMQPLAQHQRGAFAASCVQRLAPGFLTAQRSAQWECRGAYQTDALAAMLYAGRSWEPSPTNYVLQCTQRALYAAAFLDRQLAPVPEEDSLEDIRALIDHGIPLPTHQAARFSRESCSDSRRISRRSALPARKPGRRSWTRCDRHRRPPPLIFLLRLSRPHDDVSPSISVE